MSPMENRNDKLRELQIPGRETGAPPGGDEDPDGGEVDEVVDEDEAADEELDPDQLDEDELEELYEEVGEDEPATPEAKAMAIELEDELDEEDAFRRLVKKRGDGSSHMPGAVQRLYRGETSFDFVGRRRWWFLISSIIIVAGLISIGVKGLNLGIDFKGGTSWEVTAPGVSQTQAVNAVQAAGLTEPTVTILAGKTVQVQADLNSLPAGQAKTISNDVTNALAKLGHTDANGVSQSVVGPTWGGQVTQHALIGLIVFLIVVAIYISFRFEPKMAVAAFVALIHDLLVTIGVYSLAGFQVTPDTVIAVLTILGYSLYDTVVVFDRVRDNTKGLGSTGRMTYSEMVNLSMNQTLARSINTSLVAILPVLAILVVGAQILGATTLQNFGLALFIGLLSGAYSSIFIAAPVLAMMKEREPRYVAIRQRLEARGERSGLLTPAAAALMMGTGSGGGGSRSGSRSSSARSGPIKPGAAKSARTRQGTTTNGQTAASSAPAGDGVKATTGSGSSQSGSTRSKSSAARRPPPRRRKGGKKKRR